MELRFARAARTIKDFDLGLRGNRAERIRQLSEVLELGFDDFTFRLKPEQHEMEPCGHGPGGRCRRVQNTSLADD
jgi:hypothetical protein